MNLEQSIEAAVKNIGVLPSKEQALISINHLYHEASRSINLIKNIHAGAYSDEWKLNQLNTAFAYVQSARVLQVVYAIPASEVTEKIKNGE